MIRLSLRMRNSISAGWLLAVVGTSAGAATIDPPDARALLSATASGVQIYACEYDANHTLGWVFRSPRATLFDTHGTAVIEHSAGPSWEAPDGSRIVGHVLAQMPGETPDSLPNLLLETRSTGAKGMLSEVRYVQRTRATGGTAPTATCTVEHASGSSPYIATYKFFK
ncbi:DUF3455 domain-containing protein [Paraburkholderia sp. RL18-103-BIB-C]|uniref:DUF3455 domain-containing protein n=1 Tax=unclassified Paraburkholderia TaxID=2615204 RepID=UPI002F6B72A8